MTSAPWTKTRSASSKGWPALSKTFTDKASGKDVKRPQLEAMQSFVREGDTVFCHSMDRLARNLDDLRRIVLGLTGRGVHIVFVKENLTFTGEDSPMSNLLLRRAGSRPVGLWTACAFERAEVSE
jgi:DNA invertase Pin-like site-specific DNA recombinase